MKYDTATVEGGQESLTSSLRFLASVFRLSILDFPADDDLGSTHLPRWTLRNESIKEAESHASNRNKTY